jgi:hypothetical protein
VDTKAGMPQDPQPFEMHEARYNDFFRGHLKYVFRNHPNAAEHRRAYHEVFQRWVRVRHPTVLRELGGLGAALERGVSIGVHKRVGGPGTAAFQGIHAVVDTKEVVRATRLLVGRIPQKVTHIFLATDDSKAEAAFRLEFGELLHVRSGVQRVAGGLNPDGSLCEVHIRSPFNPKCGLQDAVDVLTDALLLSKCDWFLHMESNVSTAVALMNPELKLVHVADILDIKPSKERETRPRNILTMP